MIQRNQDSEDFKALVKEALAETLTEQRELLMGVVSEVLEDMAFTEAIREGRKSEQVSREEIMGILEDER